MVTKQINEIRIPNAPTIPGLVFRHYLGAEDHARMAELVNAANEADGIPEASSEESMAHYYSNPKNLDPHRDVLMSEINGSPVSYSRVYWLDQQTDREGGLRIYRSVTFMHPDWRRKGLGRAILTYNEKRIREMAAEHPASMAKFIEITIPEAHHGAAVLLKQTGFQPKRHFFIMSRDFGGLLPVEEVPAGVEIRPVKPNHYRRIWDAIEEAFVDHWGFTPRNDEDYQKWLSHPEFDPSLWVIAWDGGQLAGACVNWIAQSENGRLGRNWAWTEPIAVRRAWRRRGLARALLVESHRLMKAGGCKSPRWKWTPRTPATPCTYTWVAAIKWCGAGTCIARKLDEVKNVN